MNKVLRLLALVRVLVVGEGLEWEKMGGEVLGLVVVEQEEEREEATFRGGLKWITDLCPKVGKSSLLRLMEERILLIIGIGKLLGKILEVLFEGVVVRRERWREGREEGRLRRLGQRRVVVRLEEEEEVEVSLLVRQDLVVNLIELLRPMLQHRRRQRYRRI